MHNLPHSHCNSVYVPWVSKGDRATLTLRNNNGTSLYFFFLCIVLRLDFVVIVRHHAMGPSSLRGTAYPLFSITDVMRQTDGNLRSLTNPLLSSHPRLRIATQVGGSAMEEQPKRRWWSNWWSNGDSGVYPAQEDSSSLSTTLIQCDSPVSYEACDGWCRYDPFERRIAVSIIIFCFSVGELTIRVYLCKLAVVIRVFRPGTRLGRPSGISNDFVMQISW